MGVRVLFDPDAPYERRLPPWSEVIAALPSQPLPGDVIDPETARQRIAPDQEAPSLSQAVLAGLADRSEFWLSRVERGRRGIDSHAVLTRPAEVLKIDIEEVISTGSSDQDGQHAYPAAPTSRGLKSSAIATYL